MLTHGDFYIGNILVHNGRATSIIDWDMLGIDDPAADIVTFLRLDDCPLEIEAGRTAFLEAYRAGGGVIPVSLLRHEVRYILTMCSVQLSKSGDQAESRVSELGKALAARLDRPH